MVNEIKSEEMLQSIYDHQRALNRLINETTELNQAEISHHASIKRNFFKDCKLMLNEIIDKIDSDQFVEHPSLIKFKRESLKLISSYIDSAYNNHNEALERSKRRTDDISSQITERISLFKDLQFDYEDLEIELLDYLGY